LDGLSSSQLQADHPQEIINQIPQLVLPICLDLVWSDPQPGNDQDGHGADSVLEGVDRGRFAGSK